MRSAARRRSRPKVRTFKGDYSAKGLRFGIVVSEFNEFLTGRLLDGAVDTLIRHGAKPSDIRVVHVPGAFEIPLALRKLIRQAKLDAAMALAVVIRGQTKHFDQVVRESAKGIREVTLATDIPVICGLVTAANENQALARVGIKQMNKGREWALAAIHMASLMEQKFNK